MAQGHASNGTKALKHAIRLKPNFAEAHHRLERLRSSQQNREQFLRAAPQMLNILSRRE